MKIYGIGTDILQIKRISGLLDEGSHPFFNATYSREELAQAKESSDLLFYYATRFAGKEAVFKCFGINDDRIRLKDIEILNEPSGRPFVVLSGFIKNVAEQIGITQIQISLSYEADYAVAFALATGNDSAERVIG